MTSAVCPTVTVERPYKLIKRKPMGDPTNRVRGVPVTSIPAFQVIDSAKYKQIRDLVNPPWGQVDAPEWIKDDFVTPEGNERSCLNNDPPEHLGCDQREYDDPSYVTRSPHSYTWNQNPDLDPDSSVYDLYLK